MVWSGCKCLAEGSAVHSSAITWCLKSPAIPLAVSFIRLRSKEVSELRITGPSWKESVGNAESVPINDNTIFNLKTKLQLAKRFGAMLHCISNISMAPQCNCKRIIVNQAWQIIRITLPPGHEIINYSNRMLNRLHMYLTYVWYIAHAVCTIVLCIVSFWLYGPCMIVPHKWTKICWLATAN